MDNTISSSSRTEGGSHTDAIEFRPGMLSAMSDELTRLLLNLDAGNFRKMLDQTRNLVLEQEDEIKRSHQLIQELESKVSQHIIAFICRQIYSYISLRPAHRHRCGAAQREGRTRSSTWRP